MNEEKPREFSQGERVQKSKVKEDVDIFDEVFEGKKEKRVEELIETIKEKKQEKKENELIEKETDLEREPDEKKEDELINEKNNSIELDENEEAEEENIEEPEDELKRELPPKNELKKLILRKALRSATKELEEEVEEEKEEHGETISEMEGAPETEEKVIEEVPASSMPLHFLEDEKNESVFIGRKKSVFLNYGFDAALLIGRLEEEGYNKKKVFLDGLNPHVVFVCGARGSGKSYVIGVIAEELALKNKNVGIVVIDPIGVFWSMKYANKEEKELNALLEWELEPQGLDNLKVFIPTGMKNETPKNTYDATFSIQPSLLTSEDWCLTFGMERFGPSGLLLDKVLKKVEHGYKTTEGKYVKASKQGFSLDDLINCLEAEEELNSRERGYKQDSIRALVSRFEAAKSWGVFDEKGTPLGELSRENQLTVLDTSFLEGNVTALVIGILARRILAARKLSTRRESATKLKPASMEELLETDIPPTWMFIDEAHTLIPSGNVSTPATNALVEYVKQGRRPGCSIVFATQQPSAIDTRVLSQLDILLTHKLVFDDDIKAIYKRIPTVIPHQYKKSNFIRSLPIGYALTGDRREETSRAFVMSIRPRMSQHEGRDAETISLVKSLSKEQVENLAMQMVFRELDRNGEIGMDRINQLINSLNGKYKAKAMLSSVLDLLEERKAVIEPDRVILAEKLKEKEEAIKEAQEKAEEKIIEQKESKKEAETILSFPLRVEEPEAKKIINKVRKKKKFGLVGKEEQLKQLQLVFEPIYKISFNDFNKSREFIAAACFINAITGEFVHVKNDRFIESRGFSRIMELDEEQLNAFAELIKKRGFEEKMDEENYSETRIKALLSKLTEKGLVDKISSEGKISYFLNREIELPPDSRHSLIDSLNELPLVELKNVSIAEANFSEEKVIKSLQKMWKTVIVKKVSLVYRPFYYVSLEEDGKERKAKIDAITAKVIQ